jgi:hypothetical protein
MRSAGLARTSVARLRGLIDRAGVVEVEGWEAWQGQRDDGAVESEQRVVLRTPVVEFSEPGGEQLGLVYWREVERITRRLVQARHRQGSIELRLLGRGPSLLRFGAPTIKATTTLVCCSYPIEGGLLAQRPGGEISFAQTGDESPVVRSAIRGFFPSLASRTASPDWTGALYNRVQSRIHLAVSRRYFARLIAESLE